jgi:molybdopterin converting factor small subunit
MTQGTTVRVLLFASYAERLGRDALELEVAPGATVGDVVLAVRSLPGGAELPDRPLTARNLEHCAADAPVLPGDEVAILPPLAGG